MRTFIKNFMLPLLFGGNFPEGKIDPNLLKKTRALGCGPISAVIFSKEKEGCLCKQYLESLGAKIKYELPLINAYAVVLPPEKLEALGRCKPIKYICDDMEISSLLEIATQVIGSRDANRKGYNGKGVGVAVLDTGVYPHPDLTKPKNRIVAFKDFVNSKAEPYDDNGHGTFIAGAVAGNGFLSDGKHAGVAPLANIIGIKVIDSGGQGQASDIAAGMQWVFDNRKEFNIKVVSLSLGGRATGSLRNDPLVAAVERLWKEGIFVAIAAGNSGPERATITTPGISPSAVTVGAIDDKRTVSILDDVIADFSSRGPALGRLAKPDVVAPGVNIISLNTDASYLPGDKLSNLKEPYVKMSGTSMSTPLVAGIAALLFGKNPNYKPDQLKELLLKNARRLSGVRFDEGNGIVDVKGMLDIKN